MLEMKVVLSRIIQEFILEPVDTPDMLTFTPDVILKPTSLSIKVKFVKRNQ